MKTQLIRILFAIGLLFAAAGAQATVVNPAPGAFGPDDGTQAFIPNDLNASIELVDPLSGEFGFFFLSDFATLIPIFDSVDAAGDVAAISFGAGVVYDVEDAAIQNTFTAGIAPVGFYLKIPSLPTIYTVNALNVAGLDLVATFPSLAPIDLYLLGFEFPTPRGFVTLAYELTLGFTPVPEPSTYALFFLGLLVIGIASRRRKSGRLTATNILNKKNPPDGGFLFDH